MEVKAVTIRQIWAHLVALGLKPVENRTWQTHHRGLILIHSSKYVPAREIKASYRSAAGIDPAVMHALGPLSWWLPINLAKGRRAPAKNARYFGAIIGAARLVDCVKDSSSPWAECCMWHWIMADACLFDRPVSMLGWQGIFNVTASDELIAQIPERLAA